VPISYDIAGPCPVEPLQLSLSSWSLSSYAFPAGSCPAGSLSSWSIPADVYEPANCNRNAACTQQLLLYDKLKQHSTTPLYSSTLDTFHAGSDSLGSILTELEPSKEFRVLAAKLPEISPEIPDRFLVNTDSSGLPLLISIHTAPTLAMVYGIKGTFVGCLPCH